MLVVQRLIGYLTLVLIALVLVAMVRRRYHRLCYSLPIYLGAVLLGDLLILLWPARFNTWTFWAVKEALYAVLKLAVAIELSSLIFQAFPGARASARLIVGLGLLVALAMVFLPIPDAASETIAQQILPRLANATAVLFAAVWALALFYNTPRHPWHAAILRAFVPYLLVFQVALRLTAYLGVQGGVWASLAATGAYLAMLAYWFVSLLRPEPPPAADPEVVRRLQPWRARLMR